MSERKPYIRRQDRLWWASRRYRAYTLRELSGVGVAVYGGVILAGLYSVRRGPDAYAAFVEWLSTPFAMALHLVLLAAMLLHGITWFQTLPKTMPRLIVDGRALPQKTITNAALGVAMLCSLALVIGALS